MDIFYQEFLKTPAFSYEPGIPSNILLRIQPLLWLTIAIKMLISSSWYLYGHRSERCWKYFTIISVNFLTPLQQIESPRCDLVFVGTNYSISTSIRIIFPPCWPQSTRAGVCLSVSPIMAKMPMPGWGPGVRPGPVWGSSPSPATPGWSVRPTVITTKVVLCHSHSSLLRILSYKKGSI